jgi:hypothetical protein
MAVRRIVERASVFIVVACFVLATGNDDIFAAFSRPQDGQMTYPAVEFASLSIPGVER